MSIKKLGVVVPTCDPSTGRLKQRDRVSVDLKLAWSTDFQASQGYTERTRFSKQNKTKQT